ncbi:glycosyltransferase [Pseudomonas tussilaginis]|uniref:glycosyltransferase n=1 Tax=Pseudomonas putida TaxID=303 RepID=UPI0023649AA8|nr:glycosyltransferase [Pseudomonas putida]MDD1974996.1 glycosyltransferase [Pseudomonas putida]
MHRQLFSKRPQPYYLHAPDYRRSSAGIRVMHMLCDALNRSGQEAYVTAKVLNPELMTPRLTDEVVAQHQSQGLEPIMVYPEITDGNPLQGNTVVRYLLNQPGFIRGKGVYEEDDVLFSYTKPLLQPGMEDDRVLYLPGPDLRVFCPPSDPAKRIPGKVCYYQGRAGQAPVDKSLLPPDAIEITSRWPQTWEDLADLFQQCEYFYCTEASALAGEAALCGCLGVVMPNRWAPLKLESTAYGVAWGTDPVELERARSTNHLLRERLLKAQVDFWPALDHFIDVTQEAARNRAGQEGKRQLRAWLADRVPAKAQQRLICDHLAVSHVPTIGVLIVDSLGDNKRLMQTIKSVGVAPNLYDAVRILALTTTEAPQSTADARLRFLSLDPEQPLQSIERALREVDVDWFMLVDAGCSFTASGLLISALEGLLAPGGRAIYGDECVRTETGDMSLVLRPDLNFDLLLSLPSGMTRHWLFNRQTWLDMGGFRQEAGQAFELDYILRLIESAGFEGLKHVSETLLISDGRPLRECPDEREVIERHLRTRGFLGGRVEARLPGYYDLDYGASAGAQVSILILLESGSLERVLRCMETILEKTSYPFYEVLLLAQDNGDPELQSWLEGMEQLGTDAIRVLRFTSDLAPVQVRNIAAEHARGDFLLWLDEGVAVLEPDWLQQMLNHASRQEVAVVGAKLVGADRSISHAGFILGLNGTLGKAFVGQSLEAPGYLHRLQVDQNYAALSGKCLLIRKGLFMEAGGFDETPELQRWADVDLCLRLYRAGYLNVWTPRAQLLISEDAETSASTLEIDALYERWLPLLARDPGYHRNLSLNGKGFDLESNLNLTWRPLTWRPVPVVLAHPVVPGGSGDYRLALPFDALKQEGHIDGMLSASLLQPIELERYDPDVIVLQRQISDDQLEAMRRIKQFSRAFKVLELSEYLPNLSADNAQHADTSKDVLASLCTGLSFVDRCVVSTEALADAFSGWHGDIRVVETRLPMEGWKGLSSQRQRGRKPRVGWVGGIYHAADLELIGDVVKALTQEVEWVFLGMCPEKLRPYVHEVYEGVDIARYPQALAGLDLDLALEPLAQNLFNECKSNLRLLEYGACGFPVVCSDLRPYQGDLPVTRVKNRFEDWVEAIRMHINDLDASARMGDQLQAKVLGEWMLESDNLNAWRWAWMAN